MSDETFQQVIEELEAFASLPRDLCPGRRQ
jgi:hypothetical protein